MIKNLKSQKNSEDTSNNAQILSKWWLTYLSLLNYAYAKKQTQDLWGPSKNIWFNVEDKNALSESLEALENFYHWKFLLLKGIMLFSQEKHILESIFSFKEQFNTIIKHLSDFVNVEMEKAKYTPTKEKHEKFLFRMEMLKHLKEILESYYTTNDQNLINKVQISILRGKFQKNKKGEPMVAENGQKIDLNFNIPHSILLGWDGGIYVLLNSVSKDEKKIYLEDGNIRIF